MHCPSCGAVTGQAADVCLSCGRSLYFLTRGTVLASRYEVMELLGQGGMGMVYKARDLELDEVVAVKLLRADLMQSPEIARRFRSEIKLARKVRHRNVCGIHEYGQDGTLRYIAMEYVDGQDLKTAIRRTGPLEPREAYDIAIQAARGLEAVHEVGIVHRDLKTSNIMRDAKGLVRLMDFGIAKSLEDDSRGGATATGQIVGTPEYMSPEQVRGEDLDARSDTYALGVVVYELFTGTLPFRGPTVAGTLLMQLQDPPPLDGPAARLLPGALGPVLRRALAKSRDERFATAGEMAEALAAAQRELASAAVVRPAQPEPMAALPQAGPAPVAAADPGSAQVAAPMPVADPTPVTVKAVAPTLRSVPPVGTAAPASPSPRARPGPAVRPGRTLALASALAAIAVGAWILFRTGLMGAIPTAPPSEPPTAGPSVPAPPDGHSGLSSGSAAALPSLRPQPVPSPVPARERLPSAASAWPVRASAAPTSLPARPQRGERDSVAVPSLSPAAQVPGPSPRASAAAGSGLERSEPPSPAPLVTVTLRIIPWAEVSIDGKAAGKSPLTLRLAAGPHVFVFSHPSYQPLRRVVTLAGGGVRVVTIDLRDEALKK